MDEIRTILLKKSILEDNDADAERLRRELDASGRFLVNVMSSPGSGKTTLLVSLIGELKDKASVGVMEADIDGDVDAYTVRNAGAESVQLHTGGMCHLDADMTRQGLREITADFVFLENVGNLVCPAEFDTGAHLNMVLLSLPEGDDKPQKYTLMFGTADIVVLTKADTAKYFDFDVDKCKQYVKAINPSAKVILTSARTGEGVKELAELLYREYRKRRDAK